MTMKHLAFFTLITTLAVACDAKQDLGETASGSDGSSGGGSGSASEGSTSGGSDETGVLDTGPWSGTSGGTSSEDTGVLDTGPWSGTTGDTTGTDELCEAASAFISWDGSGLSPEELGFGGTFVGVGSCEPTPLPPEGSIAAIELACTLSGTRDGDDFVDEAISITLSFETSGGAEIPGLWPVVGARFFVGSPGLEQGSDRFFVLEQPMFPNDADGPIFFGSQGFSVAPNSAQYGAWYEGQWFDGPSITTTDASCVTGDAPRCGFDVAIEAGWLREAPIAVHGTQMGTFGAPTEGGAYDIFVETAWQAPNAFECGDDFPGSDYRFVAVGTTPQ